jgi:hypothetical protein
MKGKLFVKICEIRNDRIPINLFSADFCYLEPLWPGSSKQTALFFLLSILQLQPSKAALNYSAAV